MSDTLKQIAVAVITAGAVSFASATYYAGQKDRQLKTNTDNIALLTPQVAKIPVLENHVDSMEKRLDTYEHLVIQGQKEQREIANQILDEMRGMRNDTSENKGEIGSIKTDIQWIKNSISK